MKKEIETNEWIESYLNGEMSPGEVEDFHKRLDADPVLSHEVEMHRTLRELIADGAYIHMKNELKSIHLQTTKRSGKIRRITGFGAAGIIVVLSVLWVAHSHLNFKSINPPAGSTAMIPDTSIVKPGKGQRVTNAPGNEVKPGSHASNEAATENKKTGEPYTRSVSSNTSNNSSLSETREDTVINPGDNSAKGTGEKVAVPVLDMPAKPAGNPVTNCRKIKFSVEIVASESCNNKPTGSFKINRESASGGNPPYAFSLSKSGFNDSLEFTSLYSGNYPVYIKDGNNCIGLAGTARIGSFDCTYQAVFAPMKGETWTVPANAGTEGMLRIISKSGSLVYMIKLSGFDNPEWNGETTDGQQLPMGIYQFEIRYTDGTRFEGNVTIVK